MSENVRMFPSYIFCHGLTLHKTTNMVGVLQSSDPLCWNDEGQDSGSAQLYELWPLEVQPPTLSA